MTVLKTALIKPAQRQTGAMETAMAMVATTIRIPEPGGERREPTVDLPSEMTKRVKSGKLSRCHGVAYARLDTVGPALRAVGPIGSSLLIAMIVRGETAGGWAKSAEASGWRLDPHNAAGVLLGALDRLADHFALDPECYLPISD